MWTININIIEGELRVRVNRWPHEGRYPVQLLDLPMIACVESELATIERVGRAVEVAAALHRRELQPELPGEQLRLQY